MAMLNGISLIPIIDLQFIAAEEFAAKYGKAVCW
jgi:hypothetical protein